MLIISLTIIMIIIKITIIIIIIIRIYHFVYYAILEKTKQTVPSDKGMGMGIKGK